MAFRKTLWKLRKMEQGRKSAVSIPGQMVALLLSQVITLMLGPLCSWSTALALSWSTLTAFSLLQCMASALETLCGQAYGGGYFWEEHAEEKDQFKEPRFLNENIQKSGDDATSIGKDLQVCGYKRCLVLVGYKKAFRLLIMLLALLLSLCQADAQPENIFLLAGQSNMAGHGGSLNSTIPWDRVVPPECEANPAIFRFTRNTTWEEAREPLHLGCDDHCNLTCGVGPGIPFAHALLKLQPSLESIGLVPCAISGSSLDEWSQGSWYYQNLTDRARASMRGGGVIKALLWYQGESDTYKREDAETYGKRFEKMVNDLRTDLLLPTLPIIQVALASGRAYKDTVRAQQLGLHISNVQCVDALGSQLEPDGMHLTTLSQVLLGEKMAHAFLNHQYQIIYGSIPNKY